MKQHIEKCESHYTDINSSKTRLGKMYKEYKHDCDLSSRMDCESYSMFAKNLEKNGINFNQPKTNACKICDYLYST